MSVTTHNLGFPRIGLRRQMKFALEAYWRGESSQANLFAVGKALRQEHWQKQVSAGLDKVPVGDFSWYDSMLDMALLLGVVPLRFGAVNEDIDTLIHMARGRAPGREDVSACEMTKWFDTNYHYIVPELHCEQAFELQASFLLEQVAEALAMQLHAKPVIIGPLTFLWLSKAKGSPFDKLTLLDRLLPVYGELLTLLKNKGIEWVQIDEPILVMDLPEAWRTAFEKVYNTLHFQQPKLLLTTYFGHLAENTSLCCELPVAGLHIDCTRSPEQLDKVLDRLPEYKILSVGWIDGRNIWRTNLDIAQQRLASVYERLGERLWLAPSCSLLHCPVDLQTETHLDDELKSWLAFATQKIDEVVHLSKALQGDAYVQQFIEESARAARSRMQSSRIHDADVAGRMAQVNDAMATRTNPYNVRASVQTRELNLPLFPTTTIGSFPQTTAIRQLRRQFKNQQISEAQYKTQINDTFKTVIAEQEACGLDVLVHGEAERNDMVEYFGELLNGFAFTQNGWVQSYGSRCVKPPIIYGDVKRSRAMTTQWITMAQAHTRHYVKGMLTGPVTILSWSFVRDDQPRYSTATQIALALRDEVADLEKAGVRIIQIDEPAFREGLPLRQSEWQDYLNWAVRVFRLASSGAQDGTQIHTHMCYSEFNDIIASIADLDADVITIETSRSHMELLEAFKEFAYPNEIGPGVYDIHSPAVPSVEHIVKLLARAAQFIPPERLWVNPDCGLKTRDWPEVKSALKNMVNAAKQLRDKYQQQEQSA